MHIYNPSVRSPSLSACDIIAVGMHGSHGDELGTSLFVDSGVVNTLKRRRGFRAEIIILGDFNVDMLPYQACDPFVGWARHEDVSRVLLLRAWADQHNICVFEEPSHIVGMPGGTWSTFCIAAPISRVPLGLQDGLPSLLDFVCCKPDVLDSSFITWNVHESDHALLCVVVESDFHATSRRKRMWYATNENMCIDTLHRFNFGSLNSISDLEERLSEVQGPFECPKSCSTRRWERMPIDLRTLYAAAPYSIESPRWIQCTGILCPHADSVSLAH